MLGRELSPGKVGDLLVGGASVVDTSLFVATGFNLNSGSARVLAAVRADTDLSAIRLR